MGFLFSPAATVAVFNRLPGQGRPRALTPREQEIIALVARGLKNREIAAALSIATGTVKIHIMHIFEKTGIRDRFELAMYGLKMAGPVPEAASSNGPMAAEPRLAVVS